jgi:hypothetical protein
MELSETCAGACIEKAGAYVEVERFFFVKFDQEDRLLVMSSHEFTLLISATIRRQNVSAEPRDHTS